MERGGTLYVRPQYLDEVEALVGLPAYDDLERESTLQDNFDSIDPAQLGARVLLYTNALRILATARNEDRQLSVRSDGERFDAHAFNDRWARTLTVKGIANVADLCRAEVRLIGRQLSMRHNIERFLGNEQAWSGLYKHQHPYLESIAKFLQTDSTSVELTDEAGEKVTYFSQGATVVAPSGIGKTVLIAHTIKGLGIGKSAEGARRGEQPLRSLIVVPSQELVRQFKGEIGDNTFRRFAPDVTVGGYYAEEKDDKADVVVITQYKVIDDFRDGQLNDEVFDIGMLDEAHHLTGPGFLQTFRQHWKGPVIGFTATPDYNPEKDVRTILPYEIYHGDTVSYIKDGALNAGQLLMFRVDPWAHRHLIPADVDLENADRRREAAEDLLDQSVVDFVIPLLKEGRRGIIFCEYGNWAAHARVLAERLSEAEEPDGQSIVLPDGKPIRAEAIGNFRRVSRDGSLSPQVIQEYNEGDVHVITTTEKGREGLNADIDFVIMASSISSLLKLKQIIGRGTRLSERFPTTVYAHFFIAPNPGDKKTNTLYEAFGLERVEQGVRIAPRSVLANNRKVIRTSRLPRHLKKMSAPLHLRPIGEAVAAENEIEIPEGYMPLDVAVQGSNHTLPGAKRLLSRADFAWVGRSEMVDGERTFIRYYEPAAADFLKYNKKAPLVSAELISITGLARRLGLHPDFVRGRARDLIAQGSISLVKRTYKGREREFLDGRSQAVVEQHIREIPVVHPDDVSAVAVARRLGYSDVRQLARQEGVTVTYKQFGDSRIFQYVVSGAIASRLLMPAH
jgi:superfamily II DNA or RNA helicase